MAASLLGKDYYGILGVAKTADQKQIKSAYYQVTMHAFRCDNHVARQLAKQYHPDTNPGNKEAAKKFQEIAEAYSVACISIATCVPDAAQVLSSEDQRAKYDRNPCVVLSIPRC